MSTIPFTDLAYGGLLITALMGVWNLAKNYLGVILGWIKRSFSYTIQINDKDSAFFNFKLWLSQNNKLSKTRIVKLSTGNRPNASIPSNSTNEEQIIIPGVGVHFFMYKGKPCVLNIYKNDKTLDVIHEYTLSILFCRSKQIIQEILKEIENAGKSNIDHIFVYSQDYGCWIKRNVFNKRNINTIFLPIATKTQILTCLDKFCNNRQLYFDLGVPYKKGFLLYSPPGCGKTSLSMAIASYANYNICPLNLNAVQDDTQLLSLFNNIPEKSVVIIEDIDCIFNKRELLDIGKERKISFSQLLNSLDGISKLNDVIIIITTNRIDHIDDALRRAGRCDENIELNYAQHEQLVEMVNYYVKDENIRQKLIASHNNKECISLAEVQRDILDNLSNS